MQDWRQKPAGGVIHPTGALPVALTPRGGSGCTMVRARVPRRRPD